MLQQACAPDAARGGPDAGAMCGEGLVDAVGAALAAIAVPAPTDGDAVADALDAVVAALLERGWSTDDALCAWSVAEAFRSDEPGRADTWRARLERSRSSRDREGALRALAAMPCRLRMVARETAEALAA